MNRRRWFIFLVLTQFSLCGCVPWPHVATPSVKGTVVDKNTQKSIAGAQVSVYKYSSYPKEEYIKMETTTTDDLGKFSIKQHMKLGFLVFIGDPIPPFSMLEVKKDGYIDYSNMFWEYEVVGLNIELEPAGKNEYLSNSNR